MTATAQTQSINMAGGPDYVIQNTYTAGTLAPQCDFRSVNLWDALDAAPKTQPIPASTGTMTRLIVADIAGTAGTYPITIVPALGQILGASVGCNQIYTNYGSIMLLDTPNGWLNV